MVYVATARLHCWQEVSPNSHQEVQPDPQVLAQFLFQLADHSRIGGGVKATQKCDSLEIGAARAVHTCNLWKSKRCESSAVFPLKLLPKSNRFPAAPQKKKRYCARDEIGVLCDAAVELIVVFPKLRNSNLVVDVLYSRVGETAIEDTLPYELKPRFVVLVRE